MNLSSDQVKALLIHLNGLNNVLGCIIMVLDEYVHLIDLHVGFIVA